MPKLVALYVRVFSYASVCVCVSGISAACGLRWKCIELGSGWFELKPQVPKPTTKTPGRNQSPNHHLAGRRQRKSRPRRGLQGVWACLKATATADSHRKQQRFGVG